MLTKKAKKFLLQYQAGGVAGGNSMYQSAAPVESDSLLQASRNIGDQGIPFLSNWTKSLIGGYDFLQSFKDKKAQKVYEKQSKEEIAKKYDQMRVNSFYKTPYSYQDGGLLDEALKLEEKTSVNQFQDFYDSDNQNQMNAYNKLKEEYEQKNLQKQAAWKNRMSSGLAQHIGAGAASFGEYMSTFGGGMGGGMGAMQQGGFIGKERFRKILAPHYYTHNTEKTHQVGGLIPMSAESTSTNVPLRKGEYTIPNQGSFMNVLDNVGEMIENRLPDSMKTPSVIPSKSDSFSVMPLPEGYSEEDRKSYNLLKYGIDPTQVKKRTNSKFRYRVKQEGGEIDPTTDLYSPEFDPQKFMGNPEIEQQLAEADIADKEENTLMDWIFSAEEDDPYADINDSYFNGFNSQEEKPIYSLVNTLRQMGLEPSSVDDGEHNTGSKHYQGKALDLGLNTTFGGDKAKMDSFYEFLSSAEGQKMFPGLKVRDERTKPLNQKVWSGSHLHLELE